MTMVVHSCINCCLKFQAITEQRRIIIRRCLDMHKQFVEIEMLSG